MDEQFLEDDPDMVDLEDDSSKPLTKEQSLQRISDSVDRIDLSFRSIAETIRFIFNIFVGVGSGVIALLILRNLFG